MQRMSEVQRQGSVVAALLAGAWRPMPVLPECSAADLAAILPLLTAGGTGSLGWWRVRRSRLRNSQPAQRLREIYYCQAVSIGREEDLIRDALRRLRTRGVEPILIKGWAAARLYPEPCLRPSSDIDLCVAPAQLAAAEAVLTAANGKLIAVELHEGVPDVTDRGWPDLFRRSQLAPLGDTLVRVLGPEDQLRQLCLHFWRHHAYRPLWLCDIAAALEQAGADFDWDYALGCSPVLAAWVLCFVGLACRLLGARTAQTKVLRAAERLPPWLVNNVLWHWGNGMNRLPLSHHCRRPGALLSLALHQWFNPLQAAYRAGLAPDIPLLLLLLRALLQEPVKGGLRLRRMAVTRVRKWSKTPEKPYNLHLQKTPSSRFL
jgi:Uncharacterised nucleotidyltransferase